MTRIQALHRAQLAAAIDYQAARRGYDAANCRLGRALAEFALSEDPPPSVAKARMLPLAEFEIDPDTFDDDVLEVLWLGSHAQLHSPRPSERALVAAASGREVREGHKQISVADARARLRDFLETYQEPRYDDIEGTPWIGVDFDGTLATYDTWKGTDVLGDPVPVMVNRVRDWLEQGLSIRILTARVAFNEIPESRVDAERARAAIEEWCDRHIGRRLPVTCTKDFDMTELYDDRAVTVEKNTGRLLAPSTRRYDPKAIPTPAPHRPAPWTWERIRDSLASDNPPNLAVDVGSRTARLYLMGDGAEQHHGDLELSGFVPDAGASRTANLNAAAQYVRDVLDAPNLRILLGVG